METGLYKSVVWVHALVAALARRDIARDQLFDGIDVPVSLLGDSRARLSLGQWRALVRRAMQLTQDPGLGITLGSTAPDNVHQIVGQIAVACGTIREAFRMFDRYRALLGNSTRFDLVEEGERAYVTFSALYPNPEIPQFDAELALSLMYRVSRRYSQHDGDDAQEVWFAHAAPPYAERYAEVFTCPVSFGRTRNAILFDRIYLDEPLIYANPALCEVLRDGAERMLAEQGTPSLADRVRAMLRHEVDLQRVDAARIAKLLKLNVRTLRRQLIKESSSWSLLLDETRYRIACDELRRSDVSIRQLADRLGFSDQSAFNRAFKRWTGTTPAKYAHDAGAHPPASVTSLRPPENASAPPPAAAVRNANK